jgi:hypothetical protein
MRKKEDKDFIEMYKKFNELNRAVDESKNGLVGGGAGASIFEV